MIQKLAGTLAGTAMIPGIATAQSGSASAGPGSLILPVRRIGDLQLSALGFGTMNVTDTYPSPYHCKYGRDRDPVRAHRRAG
ncbi:MAG: hypothetical protein ABW184_15800 [Sphingobium sp.]